MCRFRRRSDTRVSCLAKVLGDWAYVRSHLTVTMTPPGGAPMRRAGYTLTIFRREQDGKWRLARDANLLVGEA